mmetsp:Transcript_10367/g.7284  ORF Transcript_10367/g.7284 Transcript_10367/m.7284 type:complete len:206 (-) Transcript_10367:254-871(-)
MLLTERGKKELIDISNKNSNSGLGSDDLAYNAGCTASTALITPTHIYCANAGDSRTVLSERGKAVDLSIDHKPELPSEKTRIYQAGAVVEEGRVNGTIAISRAIGDWEYKGRSLPPEKMAVSAVPEIKVHQITSQADFLIIACDGIWDCMSSQQAVDYVNQARKKMESYTPKASSPTKTSTKRTSVKRQAASPTKRSSKVNKLDS